MFTILFGDVSNKLHTQGLMYKVTKLRKDL